ncbi:MAG: ABC transporter ATP-binding protein [Lachnospiraceae bacterium]|nr:ABC transporter ATP-binding protein [Lachnospiraceae bacterium]
MIEINGLTKIYKLSAKKKKELKTNKDVKTAVSDLSLTAKPGEITGLLGPNGAGKTTTMRCVATLLSPTKGDIKVCGYDTVKDAQKVRDSICFLTNEIKLDEHFTVDYLFTFFGRLKNLDEKTIEARKKELFDTFNMNDFKDKKIEELSTGMKQKASIVVNLVNDPEVVIFDEPTSGLDIVTARVVLDYLKKLRAEGKTVIISTHIMPEAEKLCDKVAMIIGGRKVIEGTIPEVLEKTQTGDLEDAFFKLFMENKESEKEEE